MKDLDRIDQSFQNAYGELAKVMAELVACRSETMTPELLRLSYMC